MLSANCSRDGVSLDLQILTKTLHLVAADEGRGNTRTARGPALLFELCLVCRKFDRLLCEVRFWCRERPLHSTSELCKGCETCA